MVALAIWMTLFVRLINLERHLLGHCFVLTRCAECDHFYTSLNCISPWQLFLQVRWLRDQGGPSTNHLVVGWTEFSSSTLLEGWALYFECLPLILLLMIHFKFSILAEFEELCCLPYQLPEKFLLGEVQEAASSAHFGKSPGPDGVQAEHLCYGGYACSCIFSYYSF